MSKTKYPYALVSAQAKRLHDLMAPACQQIAIAGSLRRNDSGGTQNRVGDIEIICIPRTAEQTLPGQMTLFGETEPATEQRLSKLDPVLEALVEQGILHRDHPYGGEKGMWGERYKKLFSRWSVEANGEHIAYAVQVDLFIVLPPSQWGAQFLIRTGPADFNQQLMGYINAFTPFKQDQGQLIDAHTGNPLDTPDERAYFRALGLPYIAPHRRTADVVKAWSRGKKKRPKDEPLTTPPPDVPDPDAVAVVMDGQPVTHAQVAQLAEGHASSPSPLPLTTQIKAILRKHPCSHRIGLLQRLNCSNSDFALAIDSLLALGEITESADHFLSLVPLFPASPSPRVEQESEGEVTTAYRQFAPHAYVCDQHVRNLIRARLLSRAGLEHAA